MLHSSKRAVDKIKELNNVSHYISSIDLSQFTNNEVKFIFKNFNNQAPNYIILRTSNIYINSEILTSFFSLLDNNKNITSVNLSYHHFLPKCVDILCKTIMSNLPIRWLSIGELLNDYSYLLLFDTLNYNTSLRILDVDVSSYYREYNTFSLYIMNVLKHNHTVTTLSLKYDTSFKNNISHSEQEILDDVDKTFKFNYSLLYLLLPISAYDSCARKINEYITRNTHMFKAKLNVMCNIICYTDSTMIDKCFSDQHEYNKFNLKDIQVFICQLQSSIDDYYCTANYLLHNKAEMFNQIIDVITKGFQQAFVSLSRTCKSNTSMNIVTQDNCYLPRELWDNVISYIKPLDIPTRQRPSDHWAGLIEQQQQVNASTLTFTIST